MDKLAAIRIYDGQDYSDEIPVTALAENVQWDESSTLIDILGSISLTRKGNIQDQIDELNNRINNIHDSVVSVNGKTGTVVLNAADVGAGTGNYNKPISGIPKTDLASSVQASLGKADTALQSYTETDPTVPAWAKQPNKPTYTAQEVGALPADSQITVEVDDTLSIQGAAADAKAVGDALASNSNVSKIIASTYNDSNTYNIGSLVLYDGLLYRCRTKIETPETWTRSHWDLFTIAKSLTPLELGFLWTICDTAENDLNKIVSLFIYDDTQYNPKNFSIIGVHFYNTVPANSTLNVNNTGAKPIYKGPNPIGDNEIKAGDTAYFMLNGIGRFEFLGVDSYGTQIKTIKQDLEIQQVRAETAQALKISKPVTNPNGTQGQILQTDGQGGTVWVNKQTDEQIGSAVTDWLDDHVTPGGSTIVVDDTLSITGAAADAKKTGDEIRQRSGLSEDIKQAILQLASKVAYIDEDGQDYYDALESALYPPADLVSISAVYTQSGTVYSTDSLDSLKTDLVVTAHMSDSTTRTVTTYILFGTLTVGTSTITVSYGGKTTTFTVTVTETPKIPDGYTRYDYIQELGSNGGGMSSKMIITTDVYADLNALDVEITFKPLSGLLSSGEPLIGGRTENGTTSSKAFYVKEGDIAIHAHGVDTGWIFNNNIAVNTIHTLVFTNNSASPSVCTVDDTYSSNIEWINSNVINKEFTLFFNPSQSSTPVRRVHNQLGEFKLFNGSDMVGDYIPCIRDVDNVIGVYDAVAKVFHTTSTVSYATVGDSNCMYKVGNWT